MAHQMGSQASEYVQLHFDRLNLASRLMEIMLGMVA
jgi:hypothetical protein